MQFIKDKSKKSHPTTMALQSTQQLPIISVAEKSFLWGRDRTGVLAKKKTSVKFFTSFVCGPNIFKVGISDLSALGNKWVAYVVYTSVSFMFKCFSSEYENQHVKI